MLWSVPEQAVLSIQHWDDTAVVYFSLSGETHLLNGLACDVLQLLQISPQTMPDLMNKLCIIFDVEDKNDLQIQIQRLIGEFEILGLVESSECED